MYMESWSTMKSERNQHVDEIDVMREWKADAYLHKIYCQVVNEMDTSDLFCDI